jgi:hypothetical protein
MRSMSRCTGIVVGLTLVVTAEGVHGQDLVPTGCFDLEMGAWTPEIRLGADSLVMAPPHRIRLGAEPGKGIANREVGRSLEAAPGVNPSVHRVRFWDGTREELSLVWSTGFSGVRMQLEPEGGSLVGTARTFWDLPREVQSASVTAVPIPCDAAVSVDHRLRYSFSRGIAGPSGDSIRIGEPLPEGVDVAIESERVVYYRGELEGPFSGAEEVRIWVPDGVVREIRMRFSGERRFEDIVADMVGVFGEPTSRAGSDSDRDGLISHLAGWSGRMIRISAHGSTVGGVPSPVRVILRDPRGG